MASVREHPSTCPTCGTLQAYRGRRDLIELARRAVAMLTKAVGDADHRRHTRPFIGADELLLYEGETTTQLIEGIDQARSVLRRELYAAEGGCLTCLDALALSAPHRCTVCGARGPGCGPDGVRCRVLGCAGTIA